ncbi:MAG TPA: hypothetical protein VGC14_16570 [Rhizobium sp.]
MNGAMLNVKSMPRAPKASGVTYDLTAVTFHMLQRHLPGPNMMPSRTCCSDKSMGALGMMTETIISAFADALEPYGRPIG